MSLQDLYGKEISNFLRDEVIGGIFQIFEACEAVSRSGIECIEIQAILIEGDHAGKVAKDSFDTIGDFSYRAINLARSCGFTEKIDGKEKVSRFNCDDLSGKRFHADYLFNVNKVGEKTKYMSLKNFKKIEKTQNGYVESLNPKDIDPKEFDFKENFHA